MSATAQGPSTTSIKWVSRADRSASPRRAARIISELRAIAAELSAQQHCRARVSVLGRESTRPGLFGDRQTDILLTVFATDRETAGSVRRDLLSRCSSGLALTWHQSDEKL